jgi:hypothetical protein
MDGDGQFDADRVAVIEEQPRAKLESKRAVAEVDEVSYSSGNWPHYFSSSIEHSAPSVRTLKIFNVTQVTTTKTLKFRHAVPGSG